MRLRGERAESRWWAHRGACARPPLYGVLFKSRGLRVPKSRILLDPSFTDNEAEGSRCGGCVQGVLCNVTLAQGHDRPLGHAQPRWGAPRTG